MSDAEQQQAVALVGHCGPDSFLLRNAVERAVPGARVEMINDEAAAKQAAESGTLLLVNRVLDGSFEDESGIGLIGRVKRSRSTMLVSNYADAQDKAVAAGALPGFGKSEVGSEETASRIREGVAQARAGD